MPTSNTETLVLGVKMSMSTIEMPASTIEMPASTIEMPVSTIEMPVSGVKMPVFGVKMLVLRAGVWVGWVGVREGRRKRLLGCAGGASRRRWPLNRS